MGVTSPEVLLADLERTAPNAEIVARHVVTSATELGRSGVSVAQLTKAITDVLPESHIAGADVLKVTMHDENLELMRSGFFGPANDPLAATKTTSGKFARRSKHVALPNQAGKLDPIEINYPNGSKYWWRLSTIHAASGGMLTLNFINRTADEAQNLSGPYKAARSTMTRAEFLKLVASHVPEVDFHCEQLDKKEPVDPVSVKAVSPLASSKSTTSTATLVTSSGLQRKKRNVGLGANYKTLTAKGALMGKRQAENANIILNAAHQDSANEACTIAAIFAAIWESNLEQYADNGTYCGVLSGSHANFPGDFTTDAVTLDMAHCFFKGGKGFTSAITLNAQGMTNPAAIASHAEGAIPFDSNGVSKQYESQSSWPGASAAVAEAQAIVQAAGGSSSGGALGGGTTIEVVQPYYFQIGTSNDIHESIWDGEQRLSQEVNWSLFTDGPDWYYDAQTTLIKHKVVKVVEYGDPDILGWDYDWNSRQIATQFMLELLCGDFEYRAGDVFMVLGFGLDEATTAGRPGGWLVQDAVRQPGKFSTMFTLAQPVRQKNEPAPTVVQKTLKGVSGADTGAARGDVAAFVAKGIEISDQNLPYVWGGGHGVAGQPSGGGYDCSGYISACAAAAGWLNSPLTSGGFETWGLSGPGQHITIWCNGTHVYAEVNVPGSKIKRIDTVPDSSGQAANNGPHTRFQWPGPEGTAGFTPRHWRGA